MSIFRNSAIDKRLDNSPHLAVLFGSGGDLAHIVENYKVFADLTNSSAIWLVIIDSSRNSPFFNSPEG